MKWAALMEPNEVYLEHDARRDHFSFFTYINVKLPELIGPS